MTGYDLQEGEHVRKRLAIVGFDIADGARQSLAPAPIPCVLQQDLRCLYWRAREVVQHCSDIFTDVHQFGLLPVGSRNEA